MPKVKSSREGRVHDAVTGLVRTELGGLGLGTAFTSGPWRLTWLMGDELGESPCLSLEQALGQSSAEVMEVSDHGSVPRLRLLNRGGEPILVTDGELLRGGKQDRILNASTVIPAGTEWELPVSCVEVGRWSRRSAGFTSSSYAPSRVRLESLTSRFREGNETLTQSVVWNTVAGVVARTETDTASGSLLHAMDSEAYEKKKLEELPEVTAPEGARGMVVSYDGRILCAEVLESRVLFARALPRLLAGLRLDAAVAESSKRRRGMTVDTFMKNLLRQIRPAGPAPCRGTTLELDRRGFVGTGLWWEGRVRHLAVFAPPS